MRNLSCKVIFAALAVIGSYTASFAEDSVDTTGNIDRYHAETATTTTDGGRVNDANGNYVFIEGRTSGTDGSHDSPSPNPNSDVYTQGQIGVGTDF